jgi:hypothetical protein
MVSPQFGALSSPASQPAAFDLKGSDAVTLISTWSHLGHSNNRCSKPIGPEETRSSIIRVWQREQRGRSIAVKNCWVEDTVLPLFIGGSVTGLSVTDGCLWRITPRMAHCEASLLVNIAHIPKVNEFGGCLRPSIKSARCQCAGLAGRTKPRALPAHALMRSGRHMGSPDIWRHAAARLLTDFKISILRQFRRP